MFSFCCSSCHQPDLVFGRHAGDDTDLVQLLLQLVVGNGGKLRACERPARDAQLLADGRRRHGMVAGDHAHLDAGAVALGNGVLGLGARRVDDADHRQQRQVVHQVDQLGLGVERLRVEVAACHHHHALAHLRHPVVFLHRQALVLFDDRLHVAARQPERAAAGDQHIGRTLDKAADHLFALGILHLVEGGHELVVGVERHLGHARVHLPRAFDADAALLRQHDQRTLGRVADQCFAVQASIGAQRHRQQDLVEVDLGAAGVQQLALACCSLRPSPCSGSGPGP